MLTYPDIEVKLTGTDGNAFSILGKVHKALLKGGIPVEEANLWRDKAMHCESYDALLVFVMSSVDVL